MTCSFDHFTLRYHMSVPIVIHLMGNMLVEILNLRERDLWNYCLQIEGLTC